MREIKQNFYFLKMKKKTKKKFANNDEKNKKWKTLLHVVVS